MLFLHFVQLCAVQDLLPRANRWQKKPLKIVDAEKSKNLELILL